MGCPNLSAGTLYFLAIRGASPYLGPASLLLGPCSFRLSDDLELCQASASCGRYFGKERMMTDTVRVNQVDLTRHKIRTATAVDRRDGAVHAATCRQAELAIGHGSDSDARRRA